MRIAIGWKRRTLAIGAGLALFSGPGAFAAAPPPGPPPTYADLADLADPAQLVLQVRITRQAVLEPARSPGLAAGRWAAAWSPTPTSVLRSWLPSTGSRA